MAAGDVGSRDGSITSVTASLYRFPTPEPEADGTLTWDATWVLVVEITAGGVCGVGWTYTSPAAMTIVTEHLRGVLLHADCTDITGLSRAMRVQCRNLGTAGVVMQAISAVDVALWDLAARRLDVPVCTVLGGARRAVQVYGSGGFVSLSDEHLDAQLVGWLDAGCRAVKIKIGEDWGHRADRDLMRVVLTRKTVGEDVEVMVDANGGYSRGAARRIGRALVDLGVVWFEEPVSSDDVEGLADLRSDLGCDVTAGEYVTDSWTAARLSSAVDCLQLDASRCGGYTGFRECAAVAAAHGLDVSCHCGPALHAPIASATTRVRHCEWFADHARLEPLLFDGVPVVRDGAMTPAPGPGHGYTLREDAARYRVSREEAS